MSPGFRTIHNLLYYTIILLFSPGINCRARCQKLWICRMLTLHTNVALRFVHSTWTEMIHNSQQMPSDVAVHTCCEQSFIKPSVVHYLYHAYINFVDFLHVLCQTMRAELHLSTFTRAQIHVSPPKLPFPSGIRAFYWCMVHYESISQTTWQLVQPFLQSLSMWPTSEHQWQHSNAV